MSHPARSKGVATDERDGAEEFSFLGEDADDVESWRSFVRAKAERRAQLRRRRRMRIRVGVAGLVVVLLAAVISWHPWSRGTAPDPVGQALGASLLTVFIQVRESDGPAVAGALVSHDREADRGSLLVVPTNLSVVVSGKGRLPVSDALPEAGPSLTRDALADVLGVRIDASWMLDRPTFVRLVDRVGGLTVDLERAIPMDGGKIVNAGRQRLSGVQAYRYATYLAPGETEGARSARAGAVLSALLAATPRSYEGTRQLLDELGVLGDAGLPASRLAALLTAMSGDLDAERARLGALPLRAGGLLDLPRAAPLLRDLVAGRSAGGDATPRVLVRFAAADPRYAADVRSLLVNGGYRYVDGEDGTASAETVVLVRERGARRLGESVALTLGLDPDLVKVSGDLPATVDVVVMLADGYRPL